MRFAFVIFMKLCYEMSESLLCFLARSWNFVDHDREILMITIVVYLYRDCVSLIDESIGDAIFDIVKAGCR